MDKKEYNALNINYEEIERYLRAGKLIIYPTDTVYGVGGIIESEETIENIKVLKIYYILIFSYKN